MSFPRFLVLCILLLRFLFARLSASAAAITRRNLGVAVGPVDPT